MATYTGTTADDALFGSSGPDTMTGFAGDDSLQGGAAGDLIYGDNAGAAGGGSSVGVAIDFGSITETMINTTTTGNQLGVDTIAMANGGYLATWISDTANTGTGQSGSGQVMGQIFNAAGAKVGGEFAIGAANAALAWQGASTQIQYSGDGGLSTQLTKLTDGSFVVAWQAAGGKIFAHKLDAAGVPASGADIELSPAGNTSLDSIAALQNGGFVAQWTTASSNLPGADGSGYGAVMAMFDANGVATNTPIRINDEFTTWDQGSGNITVLADGRFISVWSNLTDQFGSNMPLGYLSDVTAQLYDAAGNQIGTNFAINTTTAGLQIIPESAALQNGGFATVYVDQAADGNGMGITLRIFGVDNAGVATGGAEIAVNTNILADQHSPSITTLADGSLLVVWQSAQQAASGTGIYATDTAGYGVYARRFSPTGVPLSDEFRASASILGNQIVPVVSATADGGYVIAWEGAGIDGSGSAVFSQRFDALNQPIGAGQTASAPSMDDSINGGGGADTLHGEGGDDQIWGEGENDLIYGGDGDDSIFGGTGADSASGGAGDDEVSGGSGADTIGGDAGDDSLMGGGGADNLDGGAGDDILTGGSGNDALTGGIGDDQMHGDAGNDALAGGLGSDVLYGGAGADNLRGIEGDDALFGDAGNDQVSGDLGNDDLQGGTGNDTVMGGAGDDDIWGNSGADVLNGDAGDDDFVGGSGRDVIFGGIGNDDAQGGTGADIIYGGSGTDDLSGGSGNDSLYGDVGNDVLTGGTGADHFFFNTALNPASVDTITDMTSADEIYLNAAVFAQIGPSFTANEFAIVNSASQAVSSAVRIIYVQNTGELYYDPNGGAAIGSNPNTQRVQFAELNDGTNLLFSQFTY